MNTNDNGREVLSMAVMDSRGNDHLLRVGYGDMDNTGLPEISSMKMSATYHGDHDEFWIVVMRGDVEQRYNCKQVRHFALAPTKHMEQG